MFPLKKQCAEYGASHKWWYPKITHEKIQDQPAHCCYKNAESIGSNEASTEAALVARLRRSAAEGGQRCFAPRSLKIFFRGVQTTNQDRLLWEFMIGYECLIVFMWDDLSSSCRNCSSWTQATQATQAIQAPLERQVFLPEIRGAQDLEALKKMMGMVSVSGCKSC